MLVHSRTGAEIKIGDTVKTFGEKACTLTIVRPAEGKSGRVYVRFPGRNNDCGLFPAVIGARFTAE